MRLPLPFIAAAFLAACALPTDKRSSVVATDIPRVQGSGPVSPLLGQTVSVAGVVTGDLQNGDVDKPVRLGGFFLQDERGDGNPATSDGVFTADGPTFVDVRVGDRVTVRGRVFEADGETRIAAERVAVSGTAAIAPTIIALPSLRSAVNEDGDVIADWEAYEGMLVGIPQPLTVADLYGLERHSSVTLSADGRIEQFTNAERPDRDAFAAHRERSARRRLVLDDGLAVRYVMPPGYLFRYGAHGDLETLRLGDEVRSLTGNLRYGRGYRGTGPARFRLVPTVAPQFSRRVERAIHPPPVAGSLRVMSFNALNFFTTLDDGVDRCGPAGRSGCRGADSAAELARQREKLVSAILAADVHIVGLMEIENASPGPLAALVAALNERAGTAWSYVDTGTIGSDAIRVGLIYDARAVSPLGRFAILDSRVDARFDDAKNRPALAQSFRASAGGGRFTVAVNHLKSKGSPCDDVGDADLGDGQGNCSATRTRAAEALADWLSADPTNVEDRDVLIIGDLNAYRQEDPLRALTLAGFVNLSPEDGAYSFAFRGEVGALDHALASPSLHQQVTGSVEWHINADEPPVLDYNLENGRDPAWFDPLSPWRASDHDPVIVGLNLKPDE